MFNRLFTSLALTVSVSGVLGAKPNVILVMADDQGWGQTGYKNHPALKTPHLDAMAANGLRFDRFYAGGPVCSPTRATVLTGRTHDRTGVFDHGYALRLQEKTLGQAMKRRNRRRLSKSSIDFCCEHFVAHLLRGKRMRFLPSTLGRGGAERVSRWASGAPLVRRWSHRRFY